MVYIPFQLVELINHRRLDVDDINKPHMPSSISAAIISSWRQHWCNLIHYKQLRSILNVPDGFSISTGTRKFDVALNRLICGNSLLTHAYFLRKTPPPTYTTCLVPLTIPHIHLECPISATLHLSLPQPLSHQTLFTYTHLPTLISFLQDSSILSNL